ncbi:unnamed protein product [Brassica oleracea var. botrytis]
MHQRGYLQRNLKPGRLIRVHINRVCYWQGRLIRGRIYRVEGTRSTSTVLCIHRKNWFV